MAAYFNEPDHTSHKEGPTNVDLVCGNYNSKEILRSR